MKRFIAVMLISLLCVSLAGCGKAEELAGMAGELIGQAQGGEAAEGAPDQGGQPTAFENKIALSIDKDRYEKEERVEVTMSFADVDKDNAVIVIVSSDMPHGLLTPAEEECEEYRWLADFGEIPFYMWAPDRDGLYDVRVYASGNNEELASVSFAVGSATPVANAPRPTEPAGASRWFTDEVLSEMKLTGFDQPEGFEVLSDEELPDAMENEPYLRVIKGASSSEEYHAVIDRAWSILRENYGDVYTWNIEYDDEYISYEWKWETEKNYGGEPFYVWDGDAIRSVSFTFSTFDGVEGELLQIGLNPNADDPRNDN